MESKQGDPMLKVKRVYDQPTHDDGKRILIDRLWPRGLKKEDANVDEWLKEIAPSTELRKWYGHDPNKWSEFKKRYYTELKDKQDIVDSLAGAARKGKVTLLYGSKEPRINNAVALIEYIEKAERLRRG